MATGVGVGLSLKNALTHTTVDDIVPHTHVYTCNVNDNLSSVFQQLTQAKISAMPVYDVKKLRKEHGGDAGVKAAISEWSHAASIHYFFDTKVSEVMNLSGHNPAAFISRKATIQEAINLMSLHHWHRVAVMNDLGGFTSVLSQTRIIQYLSEKTDWQLGAIAQKTLSELNLGKNEVVSISAESPMIDAYIKMLDANKSSVALVQGPKHVGNLSPSDLRVVGNGLQMFEKLLQSSNTIHGHQNFVLSPTSSVKDVLAHFVEKKVHRLYVVEGDGHSVGVVSPCDVLKLFATVH